MAKYNLLTNSLIESLTVSGTGNVDLTVDEKASLYDGNTTVSGISLITSDILHLEVDMYNRIRIDNIKIYLSTTMSGISNEMEFYYKDDSNSDFVLCPLGDDGNFLWPYNLPDIFAPRFIKFIISNSECELLEIGVYNEDTQVAFGSDGNETMKVLQDYEGYDTLKIFNNSPLGTKPVNAYIIVDYQGKDSDSYIKLSDGPEGEFIGIDDYPLISDDDLTSNYYWSQGFIDRIEIYQDSLFLKIDPVNMLSYGYYTTPIINLKDKFMYTYLITDQSIVKDKENNVYSSTWREDYSNIQTVKVRSSNTAPLAFRRFFLYYLDGDSHLNVFEGNLDNGQAYYKELDYNRTTNNPKEIVFDKQRSQFVILDNNDYFRKYKYFLPDEYGSLFNTGDDYRMQGKWGIDYYGNIFGRNTYGNYRLQFISEDLNNTSTLIDNGNIELVFDLSVHPRQIDCWFTNSNAETVNKVNSSGDTLVSVPFNSPTYICALNDGGCWVVDSDINSIKRLNSTGDEINNIIYDSSYSIIDISYGIDLNEVSSTHEKFWILTSGGHVIQFSFEGDTISDTILVGTESIHAFTNGCLAFDRSTKSARQLNKDGNINRNWDFSSLSEIGTNLFVTEIDSDEYLSLSNPDTIFPAYDDPVWGNHEGGWYEVNSNGYLLPMLQYHQFKYKLNGYFLNNIVINPDAETGDTTGWSSSGFRSGYGVTVVSDSNYIKEGSYGFKIYAYRYDNFEFFQDVDLANTSGVDLDVIDNCKNIYYDGYIFLLTGWAKDLASNRHLYMRFKYLDADLNPILPEVWTDTKVAGSNYWRKMYIYKKVLSGTRYIRISFYSSDYGTADIAIDDINATLIRSSGLDSIKIPRPIKLANIEPQQYKNLYIKTDFPPYALNTEYETKLRCWWGNQEE